MAADGDGTVWVTGYFGNGQGMCAIDRETRSLGDPRDLPQGVNELFFGPGHADNAEQKGRHPVGLHV